MRLVELGALGGFVLACLAFVRALVAQSARARATRGAWEPFHRYEQGRRRVYVRRGEELEPVGEVASDREDYEDAFLELMARARERAATLNSERA